MWDIPAFSRSLDAPVDGKSTEEIKTKGSVELKEKLAGLAAVHGMTSSQYVRMVLQAHVYGHLHVMRMRSLAPVMEEPE